jgi:hypothetical protein
MYMFTKAIQHDLEVAGLKGRGGNWYSTKCMIPSNARIIDFVVSDKDMQARAPFFCLLGALCSPLLQQFFDLHRTVHVCAPHSTTYGAEHESCPFRFRLWLAGVLMPCFKLLDLNTNQAGCYGED